MTSNNLGELGERLHQLARVPTLLVVCDYDGTLAPLVDDPMDALPDRNAVTAMRSLAEQANTHVAVVSGRSLRDLASLSRLPEEIRLVGSHGSEFDLGFASRLSPELTDRRARLIEAVAALGRKYSALVEEKPAGVTFHFRGMDPGIRQGARDELVRGPASQDGVHSRNGHDIVEMSVIETNKGEALETIRHQIGASAVIFFGDDVTDEDGFRTLTGPDVGVKVGDGPSAAGYRVADTETVARLLALLSESRSRWLRGASLVPIQDHSVLSDLRTAAVVGPTARVSWMCAPRIDSAAVFAELLGGPSAGYFSIADARGRAPLSQRYQHNSLVLQTQFPGFTVTDFLDASNGRTSRMAGRSELVRMIEATPAGAASSASAAGAPAATARVEFAPRLDFGRAPTRLEARSDGIVVLGTSDLMVLRSPGVNWEIVRDGVHETARADIAIDPGPLTLEFRIGTGSLRADNRSDEGRLGDTGRFWATWVSKLSLPRLERELVARSAIALKGLSHGPTGAIVSAATTSLPGQLGGSRNWDYRYCWLRDAALSGTALVRLGSRGEAMGFLDWLLHILETRSDPERLAPLYNVAGHHLPPQAEINDLPGYGGSRPVRVGNRAEGQVQIDAFGPVVELIHELAQQGEALSSEHWRLVEAMVLAVSRRWRAPDHGIWQIRKPPRHHVHSKAMCWLTVDRAISVAEHFLDREPAAWVELRDQIAHEVLEQGWKPALGAFSAAYDGDDLDASVLSLGLSGLVRPDDERFVSTVAIIERELRNGPTVHRYLDDDGLPGRDAGFNLMTSWLIDALTLTGRREDAEALFKELCELAGPTGLLAEQYDPENGRALGNVPHALSHLGLINNALTLEN